MKTWTAQYNINKETFIKASLLLVGEQALLKEIDNFISEPIERCVARKLIHKNRNLKWKL